MGLYADCHKNAQTWLPLFLYPGSRDGVLEASDLIEKGSYGDDYHIIGLNARDTIRITVIAGPENADFLPTFLLSMMILSMTSSIPLTRR